MAVQKVSGTLNGEKSCRCFCIHLDQLLILLRFLKLLISVALRIPEECVCVCVSRWLECVGSVGRLQQPVWRWDPDPHPELPLPPGGVLLV